MASRVIVFIVMERWHGWHGRWRTPLAGAFLLGIGFAVSVLAPLAGPGLPGAAAMIAGLSILGLGMGIIYSAALYYAMEVGEAEVSAGGKHEALIGLGFTLGPACGLAGTLGVETGLLRGVAVEVAVLSSVGIVLLGVGVVVARLVVRGARSNPANLPNAATVQGDGR